MQQPVTAAPNYEELIITLEAMYRTAIQLLTYLVESDPNYVAPEHEDWSMVDVGHDVIQRAKIALAHGTVTICSPGSSAK